MQSLTGQLSLNIKVFPERRQSFVQNRDALSVNPVCSAIQNRTDGKTNGLVSDDCTKQHGVKVTLHWFITGVVYCPQVKLLAKNKACFFCIEASPTESTYVCFNFLGTLPICLRKLENAVLYHRVSGHPGCAGRSSLQGLAVQELWNWQGDRLNM